VGGLEECRDGGDTVWLLTARDFARTAGEGFRWNEYECMAIGDAGDDRELIDGVTAFWDRHFPFLLAVHSDYDSLAVYLDDGSVVHGFAPSWEEPDRFADSFSAFLSRLESHVAGKADYELGVILGAT
jgi:hypothetical protein